MWKISIMALHTYHPDIFDDMVLPEGVDRDKVLAAILTQNAELGLVYTDPYIMRTLIGMWSAQRSPIWAKLYATTQLAYDPISNYDRHEEWHDEGTGSGTGHSDTTTNGFESGDQVQAGAVDNNGSTQTANKHTGHLFGNIGVTTTQQMLDEERRVARFDIYAEISQDFKTNFCIMVY